MAGQDAVGRFPAHFPSDLRVLLVDDDLACLVILKKMLQNCGYYVTACHSGEEALEKLRNNKDGFDIVMSDFRMPGINGLQLLTEISTMRIDTPVILFSDEPESDTVMKGVYGGACDFLAKPIHIGTLKLIWKHLLRKTGKERGTSYAPITSQVLHSVSQSNEQPDCNALKRKRGSDSTDSGISRDNGSLKENEQGQSNVNEAATTMKKQRMSWTGEAHNAFLEAISSLAPERVVPKKILEFMETKVGIKGLTRPMVASHLQKYRGSIKKQNNGNSGYPALLSSQPSCNQIPWNPNVSPTTHVRPAPIDLSEEMLTFYPRLRITVEDALAHPYLNSLPDISDEPTCMTPFSFEFEQHTQSEEQMKELINQDPYLNSLHDISDEPTCMTPFSFDFEERTLSEEQMKELINQDPYLNSLHDISDEPTCMTPFSFDFEQHTLSEEQMKELINQDPYLNSLHDISDEPTCMTPFSFDFEQPVLSEEQMKELIYQEALAFNPDEPKV